MRPRRIPSGWPGWCGDGRTGHPAGRRASVGRRSTWRSRSRRDRPPTPVPRDRRAWPAVPSPPPSHPTHPCTGPDTGPLPRKPHCPDRDRAPRYGTYGFRAVNRYYDERMAVVRWSWLGEPLAVDLANTVRRRGLRYVDLITTPAYLATWLSYQRDR